MLCHPVPGEKTKMGKGENDVLSRDKLPSVRSFVVS